MCEFCWAAPLQRFYYPSYTYRDCIVCVWRCRNAIICCVCWTRYVILLHFFTRRLFASPSSSPTRMHKNKHTHILCTYRQKTIKDSRIARGEASHWNRMKGWSNTGILSLNIWRYQIITVSLALWLKLYYKVIEIRHLNRNSIFSTF